MRKCKWAGDAADEYCKSCDGIKMMVDGVEKSCTECAGYEEGEEEITESTDTEVVPFEEESKPVETVKKPVKKTSTTKTSKNNSTPVKNDSNSVTEVANVVKQVSEERHIEEDTEMTANGIQVTALRYTSSATIKKGDNYYKFTAEEEWSTALYNGDIQDVRDQLWAKLNAEVDRQIEELSNM